MGSAWQGTVLLADVRAHDLVAAAGAKRAVREIEHCVEVMEQAARGLGGQVVRTKGDELMVLFPGPAAAAEAAAAMQAAVEALAPVGRAKLGVRIAFQQGTPSRGGDVLGETVKLASALLERAHRGRIVTTPNTARELGPDYSGRMRALSTGALYELLWRREVPRGLLLRYGPTTVQRAPDDAAEIRIGRDFESDLIILDDLASRRHCTIARHPGGFVIEDHSSNGTYVTEAGAAEVALRRTSCALARQGVISFGHPRTHTGQIVEYLLFVRN